MIHKPTSYGFQQMILELVSDCFSPTIALESSSISLGCRVEWFIKRGENSSERKRRRGKDRRRRTSRDVVSAQPTRLGAEASLPPEFFEKLLVSAGPSDQV